MNKCQMCDQFFHTINKEGYCKRCWDMLIQIDEQDDGSEFEEQFREGY